MFGNLVSDFTHYDYWISNPVSWLFLAFQIWMFVDAVRREEWIWALFIFLGFGISALFYYFLVYRAAPSATRGFELPGAHDRKRIQELEAQIHHLDKAHHHLQLGDIYFQKGNLARAEACYRASLEREAGDIDARAHLGQCLLRQKKLAEAQPLLEKVCAEDPKHDYGHSLMALAETQTALGKADAAMASWRQVLEHHAYARARVQLAELYLATHQHELARAEVQEVLADDVHAPAFQRKREKVWVRRANQLLRRL